MKPALCRDCGGELYLGHCAPCIAEYRLAEAGPLRREFYMARIRRILDRNTEKEV